MEWLAALILKYLLVYPLAFLYYVFVYKGGRFICRFLPRRWAYELLRERGSRSRRPGHQLQ